MIKKCNEIDHFFDLFILSGIAEAFETGAYEYTVGKSGIELAYEVIWLVENKMCGIKPKYTSNRSEEYWTGWALAYYQWYTCLSFKEVVEHIPIKQIQEMYSPYHKMDVRQFVDKMNQLYTHHPTDNKKPPRL